MTTVASVRTVNPRIAPGTLITIHLPAPLVTSVFFTRIKTLLVSDVFLTRVKNAERNFFIRYIFYAVLYFEYLANETRVISELT